jgi:hypothetical protein
LATTTEVTIAGADRVHVEHIYPQNPRPLNRWEEHARYVNRLGNLTLLDKRLNEQIKNSDFPMKKETAYKDSRLEITKVLLSHDSWSKDTVTARQEMFRDMAKHQNISAVLDELGMPWIPGYKPKRNYQNAIFAAIDRYLTKHPAILEPVSASPPAVTDLAAKIFVAPPVLAPSDGPIPEPLRRLIRKFDPVERDHRNRILGKAGEEFVVHVERRKLTEESRPDLARKVRWIAAEDGDGAGYDVLSFDLAGCERLLEVKTTNGSSRTPFFLTRNEWAVATERLQTGPFTGFTCSLRNLAFLLSCRLLRTPSISGRTLGGRLSPTFRKRDWLRQQFGKQPFGCDTELNSIQAALDHCSHNRTGVRFEIGVSKNHRPENCPLL